jgi:hypothetical protein
MVSFTQRSANVTEDEMETKVKTIIELLESGELANRATGEITDTETETKYHYFRFNCERYEYDFDRCPPREGWQQYDTSQDAHYFGVWVHVGRQIIVTYAEGDEYVQVYKTREAFKEALDALGKFYGAPPPAFVVYGENDKGEWTRTEIIDVRPAVE